MRKLIILIFVSLSFFYSCGNLRNFQQLKIEQKDSVIIYKRDSIIFKDSIIYTKLPYERISEKVEDTDTSFLETSLATSKAFLSEGRLHHTLENKRDSLANIIPIPFKFHIEVQREKQRKLIIQTIEIEKKLSKWQRFIMNLGYICIGIIICIMLFFFFKSKIMKFLRIFGV